MPHTAPKLTEVLLAGWTQSIKRSMLQEMLSVASRPGIISFALGLPAAEFFPAEAFSCAAAHVLSTDSRALQYGPPFQPLKSHIVSLMARRGVACKEEQVFLTAGAQQGMSLLARLLLNSGSQVIMEELTYTGFQQVLEPFQPDILTVPTDFETGMDVDAVEHLLKQGARPSFIYAISDGHNPLGASMSADKRARLVDLARQYCVPIVEDDAYGFLYYGERPIPPMRALDEQIVFYVGSFSKILAPALRVGWIVMPEQLMAKLSIIKEASDIDTSTLNQRIISAYLDTGELPGHIAKLRREYRARRDTMLRAMDEHLPDEAHRNKPSSGVFAWVELDEALDAAELLNISVETERVAFIPGQAFCVNGRRVAAHCLRLNFSNPSPEIIQEGIERLARVLKMRRGV